MEAIRHELRGSRHAVYPAADVASIGGLIGPASAATSHSINIPLERPSTSFSDMHFRLVRSPLTISAF
jgi:hypothetical protein